MWVTCHLTGPCTCDAELHVFMATCMVSITAGTVAMGKSYKGVSKRVGGNSGERRKNFGVSR